MLHAGKCIGPRLIKECAKVNSLAINFVFINILWLTYAQQAVAKDCRLMNGIVSDWNTKAQDLYKSIGAHMQKEWITITMDRYALRALIDAEDHAGAKLSSKL